jgi:hypothetical protein
MCEPSGPGLAQGISRVLTDEHLATSLASNADAFARQELSWPGFVNLIARIYATAEGRA